ncbi:MAG: 50S ribosomal protein L6 [Candidatus Yonathbacteria bacterium]|nr:50S ribosomal protein L6 [Candidatus Yonathbacteria bacterium]
MSRIGKQIITIPAKTDVTLNGSLLTVKGPLGELTRDFPHKEIAIVIDGGMIIFEQKKDTPFTRALWGTYASHVKNMIDGVNKPYEKKLIVEGVGFKADVKGDEIVMALGFSHPVMVKIPKGITATSEKNTITLSSIDKELIGRFAAKVRELKKPEPYKGKGIRYDGEVIRRKQGKKSA